MQPYKSLKVYEKSYNAAIKICRDMAKIPKEEKYGVVDQLKRSTMGIPANIAEGYGKRESAAEYRRFLIMAKGSCYETMTWINFCYDLGYMSKEWEDEMLIVYDEIARMLHGLANPKTLTLKP